MNNRMLPRQDDKDFQNMQHALVELQQQVAAIEGRLQADDDLPVPEESHPGASLARALLLARMKTEPAIRLAVGWYVDAAEDLTRLEQLAQKLPRANRQDPIARGRRQLHKCRQMLDELAVEIRTARVGDTFDPQCHDPVTLLPTSDAEQVDTVATVLAPAFLWRDEFGQSQSIPAQVIVFRGNTTENPNPSFDERPS